MKSTLLAIAPTSLFLLFSTVACGQFVPRNVSVTVVPGAAYYYGGSGQAITPYGDALRGQGLYFQGQGRYLHGAADHLRAQGQYEYNRQQTLRLSMENHLFALNARRTVKSQIQADKSAAQTQQRNARLERQTRELRDDPNAARIASGESLNYLLKRLGADVQDIEMALLDLTADELASVRLQTYDGLTLDEIQGLLTESGGIAWPASLRDSDFASDRSAIEQLLQNLIDNEQAVPAQPQQIKQFLGRVQQLQQKATARNKQQRNVTAWNEARDFLKGLQSVVSSFDKLNPQSAPDLLAPQFEKTDELLQHMLANDLQFAPSDSTGASTYTRIHAALAEADRRASSATASR